MFVSRRRRSSIAAAGPTLIISSVVATQVTEASVTVTWTTNIASTSRLDYGSAGPTTVGSEDTNLVTSHSVTVTGISPLSAWSQSFSYVPRSRPVAGVGSYTSGVPGFIGLEYFLPRVAPFAVLADKRSSSVGSETTDGGTLVTTRLTPFEYNDLSLSPSSAHTTIGYPSIYIRTNILRMVYGGIIEANGLPGTDANPGTAGSGGQGFNGGGGGGSASGSGAFANGGAGGFYSAVEATLRGSNGENISLDSYQEAGDGGVGEGLLVDTYAGYGINPQQGGSGGEAEAFDVSEYGLGGGGGASGGRIVIESNEFVGDANMERISATGGEGGQSYAVDNGAGSYGNSGSQGGDGTVHLYFRKYDGSLAGFIFPGWEIYEVGTDGTTLTQHFDLTDTWNNL